MKHICTVGIRYVVLTAFCVACAVSTAAAAKSPKAAFALSVDEQGISLAYNLGILGEKEIIIPPGGSETVFSLPNLVTLNIGVEDVEPAAETIHACFTLNVSTFGDVFNIVLPLPFLELGIESHQTFNDFIPVDDDAMFSISYLFSKKTFQYNIALDLLGLYSDAWDGQADRQNNVIFEQITIEDICLPSAQNGTTLDCHSFDADIVLVPVFLYGGIQSVGLSFKGHYFRNDELVGDIAFPGDIPVVSEMLSSIPVPLPQGSYRVWLDSGFETLEELLAWLGSALAGIK